MHLEVSRIPGQDATETPVVVVTLPPRDGRITLSVDPVSVRRGPLIRGRGPAYMVGERDGRPVRFTEQADQRRGFLSAVAPGDSHLARFRAAHPNRVPVSVTGCGNLGMNVGVTAQVGDRHHGVQGPPMGSLSFGSAEHRGLQGAPFALEDFRVSGPQLLTPSGPAHPTATQYGDPRHLVLFPFVEIGHNDRIDFGDDALLADPTRYQQAVDGSPIELPLEIPWPASLDPDTEWTTRRVEPAALRDALAIKGYRESRTPSERGTFALTHERLTLVFLEGIYPHHALAVTADGRPTSVLVGGKSNRAGVTIRQLSAALASAGYAKAILLDNGGDVGCYDVAKEQFTLAPAEPDRKDAWPLSACLIFSAG